MKSTCTDEYGYEVESMRYVTHDVLSDTTSSYKCSCTFSYFPFVSPLVVLACERDVCMDAATVSSLFGDLPTPRPVDERLGLNCIGSRQGILQGFVTGIDRVGM